MAAGDITFGTPVALVNMDWLESVPNTQARPFGGAIVNSGEVASSVELILPIPNASTSGTYDIYLIESLDGTNWTDGIDPTVDVDVSAKVSDARRLASPKTNYNVTNRAEARVHISLGALNIAKHFSFVFVNSSDNNTPATGFSGRIQTKKVSG